MTPDLKVMLRAEEGLKVMGHVDASVAVHPDMKGQSGAVITLGSGPVKVASKLLSLQQSRYWWQYPTCFQ